MTGTRTTELGTATREAPATSRTRREEKAQRTTSPQGRWIDSHCHLDGERIPGGATAAIAAAVDAGVDTMVCVGCDRASSLAGIKLAEEHPQVHATVGLHPHEARHGVESVADLFATAGIVAVGECGLDFHYDHSPRDAQRTAFAEQIAVAHERSLPLVIHTREAWDETFEILDREGVPVRTIFHCFTGGVDEMRECVERSAYVSFAGIVTFPSATDVQAAARECPLQRLLVETDSPFLAPAPNRGKPNSPAWVPLVGEAIASLRRLTVDEVRTTTRAATLAAFPGLVA